MTGRGELLCRRKAPSQLPACFDIGTQIIKRQLFFSRVFLAPTSWFRELGSSFITSIIKKQIMDSLWCFKIITLKFSKKVSKSQQDFKSKSC